MGEKKWSNDKGMLLLLTIMETLNVKIPRNRWNEIAMNFDGKSTGSACRRQYEKLRRGTKPSSGSTTSSAANTPSKKHDQYSNNDDDEEVTEDEIEDEKEEASKIYAKKLFAKQEMAEPKMRSIDFDNRFIKPINAVKKENTENDQPSSRRAIIKSERVDWDGTIILDDE